MQSVREYERTAINTADIEAQKHNAQIRERYNRLLSAEADQLAPVETPVQNVRASVLAPEAPAIVAPVTAPVFEQEPQVTEFVREQVTSSVFTTEKFDKLQQYNSVNAAAVVAPTYVAPVFQNAGAAALEVEQYTLSAFAKKVIAGVGAAVVALVSIIGINTHVINTKKAELSRLQNRRIELTNENESVEEQIKLATSEETIRAWAEQQIKGN